MASNTEESSDFQKMTVLELKKYLVDRAVTVNGYNKGALAEIANSVHKMDIPCIHTMHDKVCGEKGNELFIDDMQIGDPFKMTDLGGYVQSLLIKTLTNERLHVYVG